MRAEKPVGFVLAEEVITREEERELVAPFETLQWDPIVTASPRLSMYPTVKMTA